MLPQFPKHCNCCHKDYTPEDWAKLSFVGVHDDGFEKLEYRNCGCGTTLIIRLEVTCKLCKPKGQDHCSC